VGNHRPGDDEVAAMNFLGEGRGDDADWKRHDDKAREYGNGRNKSSRRCDGHDISVTYGVATPSQLAAIRLHVRSEIARP